MINFLYCFDKFYVNQAKASINSGSKSKLGQEHNIQTHKEKLLTDLLNKLQTEAEQAREEEQRRQLEEEKTQQNKREAEEERLRRQREDEIQTVKKILHKNFKIDHNLIKLLKDKYNSLKLNPPGKVSKIK